MVPISPVPALARLYFYVSTFRSMCAVPNMAVFCSSLTSRFPGMLLTYFLNYYYYYYYYYGNKSLLNLWASSKIVLHCSLSFYLHLQFLTPMFFRSSSTDSSHLKWGFPTRRVPSDLRRVRFLRGSSPCILSAPATSVFLFLLLQLNDSLSAVNRLSIQHIYNYPSYAFQTHDKDAPRRSQNKSN
jgi:hypothetical protein